MLARHLPAKLGRPLTEAESVAPPRAVSARSRDAVGDVVDLDPCRRSLARDARGALIR